MSPLHHAVLSTKADVVKYLLSLPQVDPNVGEGVRTGDPWLAEVLPRRAVMLIAAPLLQIGATPLHYAARGGWLDIVRVLLACSRVDPHVMQNVSQEIIP